jgi:hypothetical protein
MAANLFDELKKALTDLKAFIDSAKGPIKQAVGALKDLGLPIGDLLTELVGLLGRLQKEVENLDVTNVPGLGQVSTFTTGVRGLLEAARNLLPDESADIDKVLGIADVVSALPSFDEVKAEIVDLIKTLIVDLNDINS